MYRFLTHNVRINHCICHNVFIFLFIVATSRSGSPSSRLPYNIYNRGDHESPRPRRLSSGIPRSTAGSRDASREGSPTRGTLSRLRAGANDRPPLSPASRPVMAQKILQQSREAENALADALVSLVLISYTFYIIIIFFNFQFTQGDTADFHRLQSPRKGMRSLDNHSDDSETSSLCSEKSFDSYRRPSDVSSLPMDLGGSLALMYNYKLVFV